MGETISREDMGGTSNGIKKPKVMQEATKCLYELSEEENIQLMCEGRERYQMDVKCARDEGRQAGIAVGLAKGRATRIDEERKNGIRNMVSTLTELDIPPKTISEKLQKKYSLSPEEAQSHLNDLHLSREESK